MQTFIDDDEGYLRWVDAHPDGWVVNCHRSPILRHLVLHRAACWTIRRVSQARWTTLFTKHCAQDQDELHRWAERDLGGKLRRCRLCCP